MSSYFFLFLQEPIKTSSKQAVSLRWQPLSSMSRRWRPCGAAAGAPPRRRGGSALATAARLAAPSVVCQRLVHPARARRARRGGARQMAHTQAAQLEAHVALLRCPASPWGALCELGGLQTHAAKPARDAEKDREEPRTHARTTHARARLYIRLPRTDIQFSCSRFTQGAHEIFSEAGWPTCTLWGRAAGLSSCPQLASRRRSRIRGATSTSTRASWGFKGRDTYTHVCSTHRHLFQGFITRICCSNEPFLLSGMWTPSVLSTEQETD